MIPCLDVADGRVVKGVRFADLESLGSPAEAAKRYTADGAAGADEIVFLDIAASHERRGPALAWIERVAESVFIPLTVGGGVRTLDDARDLLAAGADKVALNSAAVARPELLTELAERYGRQCVVLSVDVRRRAATGGAPRWEVVTQGGRQRTGLDALDWIADGIERGAGELLLTSIDRDGTGEGFDCALVAAAAARVERADHRLRRRRGGERLRRGARRGRRRRARGRTLPSRGAARCPELKRYLAAARISSKGGRRERRIFVGGVRPGSCATTRQASAGGRAGRLHRPRADARLGECRGSGADAARPARRISGAAAGRRSGARARARGTSCASFRSSRTVTATAFSCGCSPTGPACHTGATSCFDAAAAKPPQPGGLDLGALERIVAARAGADPEESYTARLFAEGIERMAQKVGEEATEVVIAALAAHHARDPESEKIGKGKGVRLGRPTHSGRRFLRRRRQAWDAKQKQRLVEEASDLLFHLLVLLRASGVTTTDLASELSARHRRRARASEDGSAPLPKTESRMTTVPPEQSEPTGPRPSGKRRA